jgi:DNA-binding transcriptional MerR regulator
MQHYTVKQLSDLAGVSPRTLHYYDEIGLLKPDDYGENGYRYYDELAILRLQQILFFKELDFQLKEIKRIIDKPQFDQLDALRRHRTALQQRVERISCLIDTIDNTILHLQGKLEMSKKDFYKGFDEAQQQEYEQQARQRWGDSWVNPDKDWNSYTPEKKNDILAENHEIQMGIVDNMDQGYDSPQVQYWVGRWHQAINNNFYDCSLEIFEALGHMYPEDPQFRAAYEDIHPGVAEFMEQAMTYYCQQAAAKQTPD